MRKKAQKPLSIAITMALLISPIVQAKTETITVGVSPIKAEEIIDIKQKVLKDLKIPIQRLMKANDDLEKVTLKEKETLINCNENTLCVLDYLQLASQARDSYSSIVDGLAKQLFKVEREGFKTWINSSNQTINEKTEALKKQKQEIMLQRTKVTSLIKGFSKQYETVEQLSNAISSDQRAALEIFGSNIAAYVSLLKQKQHDIASLKEMNKMTIQKQQFVHNYANKLKVRANKYRNDAMVQRSASESIRLTHVANITQNEINTLFFQLEKDSASDVSSFLPDLKDGYVYTKSPDTPLDHSGLSFLENGLLDQLDKLLAAKGDSND